MLDKIKLVLPKWIFLLMLLIGGLYLFYDNLPDGWEDAHWIVLKVLIPILWSSMIYGIIKIINSHDVYFLIFDKPPIRVLTDYGYNYIHIDDDGEKSYPITIHWVNNYFFYWKRIKSSETKSRSVMKDHNSVKSLINKLCVPINAKTVYDVVSSNRIMTDRKELIRELNIDKVLDNG